MTARLALLSVSDRTGLVDFARALAAQGFELLSTGGTAQHLGAAGLAVTNVSDLTGFPEVFGGRVKTLHPKLFGGILFNRSEETHRGEAKAHGVGPIDLVVVNLYPFEDTVAQTGATFAQAIEKIDVGGPSLLRAAAKNHAHVGVVCEPADYPAVAAELAAHGGALTDETRKKLAAKVFRRTAAYDAAIARWISGQTGEHFPERLSLSYALATGLRYGENPHQKAALYADHAAHPAALSRYTFVQGKELSYNNFLDADAALYTSRVVGPNALTIVKHRIPSGAATGRTMAEAFECAWASDPIAGFGGVVAYTGTLDAPAAAALTSRFLEVVVVHGVSEDAKSILAKKPNLRVLTVTPEIRPAPPPRGARHRRGAPRAGGRPPAGRGGRLEGRHEEIPDRGRAARDALREPRAEGRRVERNRRRDPDRNGRNRRRPHEPRGRLPRRGRQGRRAGEGRRRRLGRVLPVPRRSRGARGSRRHGDHPARRLREGPRRHRRGGRRGNCDGVHGKKALQALRKKRQGKKR